MPYNVGTIVDEFEGGDRQDRAKATQGISGLDHGGLFLKALGPV